MARVANLDKNPRVKTLVSITGEKYKHYKVILTDTFYRKVYRGDAVHCSVQYENRVNALHEQITKLESHQPETFALNGEIEIGASTLTDAHDYVDKLLTLEGWYQYRAGMISAIQDEIKKEEEKIKERDRTRRENSVYTNMEQPWMNAMFIKSDRLSLCGPSSTSIHGAVGHTVKEVAESNVDVADWKEKELKRLFEVLEKVNKNIEILQGINVREAQEWIDGLKTEAIDYIENGKAEN